METTIEPTQPETTIQALDPERQQRAKEYSRIGVRLTLFGLVFDGAYAALWLFAGWALGLRAWLQGFTQNEWLLVAGFVVVIGGIEGLIKLPLSYYSGFILPHRYGMSTQTLKGWITDQVKGLLVAAPIGILVVEVVYFFLRAYPTTWWLWAGGFLVFFSVLLANLAPILLFPIFFAPHKVAP